MFDMRGYTPSKFFLVSVLFVSITAATANSQHARGRRGLKGTSAQRTTLSESDSEDYFTAKINRRLQEDGPDCSEIFDERKNKFDKFDDDWYNPCLNTDIGNQTDAVPTESPATGSPSPMEVNAGEPSSLFDTATPTEVPWADSFPPLSAVLDQANSKLDRPMVGSANANTTSPEESEETTLMDAIDNDKKEKTTACLQAKAGQIIPTPWNFTIYYQYELLAKQNANLTGEVWPEIDRAFQRFLSLTLIDCDVDIRSSGASPTFKSRIMSISPEPIDSVGSLYPNGWSNDTAPNSAASSCSKIVMDDAMMLQKELFCDVVTGSVTIYLSEVSYTDGADDLSMLFLKYHDEIFEYLEDEINEGGEAITNYFDTSLGIRGFHFLSESANMNYRPIMNPDAALDKSNSFGLNNKATTRITIIAAAVGAVAVLIIAAGAFAFYRRRRILDEFLDSPRKEDRTPRMDDNELDFFGLDNNGDGSPRDPPAKRSDAVERKAFFPSQGNVTDTSTYDSVDESKNNQRYNFDESRDLNERSEVSSQYSKSFDYSQVGVSLCSPEKSIGLSSHVPRKRLDPTMTGSLLGERNFSVDPEIESKIAESTRSPNSSRSLSGSSVSKRSFQSPSEASTSSKHMNSVKGSPALEYILALGSTYLSPPATPFDEESIAANSTVQGSIRSYSSKLSLSQKLEKGEKRTGMSSNISQHSPNCVSGFGSTLPSLSSYDDGSTVRTPVSSGSRSSSSSRVEYLRNRRKDLESRFQNYRRSLSESMDQIDKSPSGSYLKSREFSRSASLHKNSDASFSSPGLERESPSSVDSESMRNVGKQRLRVQQMHDFEELLSNDDEWGIDPPDGYEEELTRRQAKTVIL